MHKFRPNRRKLTVFILIITQIVLILYYFHLKADDSSKSENEAITFIKSTTSEEDKTLYLTKSSKIHIETRKTARNYVDFNSSMCYINGTDLVSMKMSANNWKCSCMLGWHGKDCGQPEIVWRAFMTYRRNPLKMPELRKFDRKLIYIFKVDEYTETITEIRINELSQTVDLFVLCEHSSRDFLERKLINKFLKDHQHKILYLKVNSNLKSLWLSIRSIIENISDDDLVLVTNSSEIPNKFALDFLKKYDNWPEPVRFRLRWSVFGYFWLHPVKTVISGGACSVAYFRENLASNFDVLNDNKTLASLGGIILGDLNHFGGWYCEYCLDSHQIAQLLTANPRLEIDLDKIDGRRIDTNFIEDLIENGLYIDGKTELTRARRYQDKYFAPYHVLENNWHYDPLLINFYTKLDYYEG